MLTLISNNVANKSSDMKRRTVSLEELEEKSVGQAIFDADPTSVDPPVAQAQISALKPRESAAIAVVPTPAAVDISTVTVATSSASSEFIPRIAAMAVHPTPAITPPAADLVTGPLPAPVAATTSTTSAESASSDVNTTTNLAAAVPIATLDMGRADERAIPDAAQHNCTTPGQDNNDIQGELRIENSRGEL